jgi:hypothetical protein
MWFKQFFCRHIFLLRDLEKTNIPELPKPTSNDYKDWYNYINKSLLHDSHTKRVKWPCMKCGKVFYAHCGLEISPDNGPTHGL